MYTYPLYFKSAYSNCITHNSIIGTMARLYAMLYEKNKLKRSHEDYV